MAASSDMAVKVNGLLQSIQDGSFNIDEAAPEDMMLLQMLMAGGARSRKKVAMLPEADCIPGSDEPNPAAPSPDAVHFITKHPLDGPWPAGLEVAMVGMGCFWCSESLFYEKTGVYSTQVGYAGGVTQNPTYDDVCTGRTNHNEVCRIVFDPNVCAFEDILKIFWETHDPRFSGKEVIPGTPRS